MIDKSLKKTTEEALNYNLSYNIKNKDIIKLFKNNLILDICNFKNKTSIDNPVFYIDEETLHIDKEEFRVVIDVISALELFKKEKSINFYKNFIKYLKKSELTYLYSVYFKQVSNKLTLFR